jgi:ribosomal protein S18 acetylase RimI-like enzyme
MTAAVGVGRSLFTADSWLGETLGRPVYRLAGHAVESGAAVEEEFARLAGAGSAFFYAKVPTADIATSLGLQRAGFGVIDTAITLAWTGALDNRNGSAEVVPARPGDGAAITHIAETCFVWSRFHLDPQIPDTAANLIKRRWIESYLSGKRGSALYAASVGGRVAGFLAVIESEVSGRRVAVIDLVGVQPGQQGAGVGSALVDAFVRNWKDRADELRVGTQAANIRSLRFYESHGFRITDTAYVLHAHTSAGRVRR